MVHVVESKPAKRYGDYFFRQIFKVGCLTYCVVDVSDTFQMLLKTFHALPSVCFLSDFYICVLMQLEGVMSDVDRIKLEG